MSASVLRSGPAVPHAANPVDDAWNRLQTVDNASSGLGYVDNAVLRLAAPPGRAFALQFDLGSQQPVGVSKPTDRGSKPKLLLVGGPFHCVRIGVERTAR